MLLSLLALAACPGTDPQTGAHDDPCEPGGHLHRGATEAETSCHCNQGYVSGVDGRSCEVDPNATAGYPFEATGEAACALAASGPFAEAVATEPPTSVDAFDTTYTLTLEGGAGLAGGVFHYRAATTGKTLFFLGADLPFTLEEQSVGPVELEQGPAPTHCEAFGAVWGASLLDGVLYSLHLGPSEATSVRLLIRPVR